MVKIGLVQMKMSASPEANQRRALAKVRLAAKKGARIVCLPELYRTLYFPQAERDDPDSYAETVPGPSSKAFCALSLDLGISIIVPIFEKADKLYNTALVIEGGRIIGTYRKMHIPHDPLFYEQNYFAKGDQGFQVFKAQGLPISPLICFDQWFPEAARINALKGAKALFYPTAIGFIKGLKTDERWDDAWITIQRSHAIANSVYVAAVNRVGAEGKLRFFGSSFICDPFGKVLVKAPKDKEAILVADVDVGKCDEIKESWGFMRNRRTDAYHELGKK